MLIKPYLPGNTFTNFPNLDIDLAAYYHRIYDTVTDFHITPRYFYESGLKIAFRDIFWYIDRLYDKRPQSLIDVGCGECIWKKWFPNIIGFDPNTNEFSQQDFIDYFDHDFSENNSKKYDCGMALNSLHFISWNTIPNQINLAMNIVRHSFLFTFNFNVIKDIPQQSIDELSSEFTALLQSLNYTIELLDYPHLRGIPEEKINNWSYINGHVRFILSNKSK